MYEYRKLCEHEQMELVSKRIHRRHPWHSPPHSSGTAMYMITAACFEHACHMPSLARRREFAADLLAGLEGRVLAWTVLPNHYHALWEGDLKPLRTRLARLHNGTATRWNREDGAPGRQVWFHFSDRKIRSDAHCYASVNYVHANAVKHGWVERADEWETSSLADWLEEHGREHLVTLWKRYPPGNYGQGWDD